MNIHFILSLAAVSHCCVVTARKVCHDDIACSKPTEIRRQLPTLGLGLASHDVDRGDRGPLTV